VSIVPSVAQATAPAGLERFLYALGSVESGGSYTSRNTTSGAYGKYQILPSSWAAWARIYLGSSTAPQTPANQEVVAHHKVKALYNWLDTWPRVAHWWLTGSGERNSGYWSSFSRTYVDRVMAVMQGSGEIVGSTATSSHTWIDSSDTRLSEGSGQIVYAMSWSTAAYSRYAGSHVRYATRTGASATITFNGKGIAWIGPVGPTRGTARIFIDGKAVATVNLRRSGFRARSIVYSKAFKTAGTHTLKIVVTSRGRPVAIDELIVGT
jgi:hypothetical protein